MTAYTLGRLAALLPVLLGVSLLAFSLANLAPGDPAEQVLRQGGQEPTPEQVAALRQQLGLDAPFLIRYGRWLGAAVRDDLGRSYASRRPVAEELASRFPATLRLAVASLVLALVVGISGGVAGAEGVRPRRGRGGEISGGASAHAVPADLKDLRSRSWT